MICPDLLKITLILLRRPFAGRESWYSTLSTLSSIMVKSIYTIWACSSRSREFESQIVCDVPPPHEWPRTVFAPQRKARAFPLRTPLAYFLRIGGQRYEWQPP